MKRKGKLALIGYPLLLLLLVLYFQEGLGAGVMHLSAFKQNIIFIGHGLLALITIACYAYLLWNPPKGVPTAPHNFISSWVFIFTVGHILGDVFLFTEDLWRISVAGWNYWQEHRPVVPERSFWFPVLGLSLNFLALLGFFYGLIWGINDYRVRRYDVPVEGLPDELDGVRIGHISDIHAGSYFGTYGLKKGIKKLRSESTDLICFTGDLINQHPSEIKPYIRDLAVLDAPYGVYAVLGNHDYGTAFHWCSDLARKRRVEELQSIFYQMEWDLLLNDNRLITIHGKTIGIIGVENWSHKKRFPTFGDLKKARAGMESADVRILLSHDPSHWEYEVSEKYTDINLTLSGHTHGMQFGIEWGGIRWSPVQYVYRYWHGLYRKGKQWLYVNCGFGFMGFSARIGMPPEIAVLTLKKEN